MTVRLDRRQAIITAGTVVSGTAFSVTRGVAAAAPKAEVKETKGVPAINHNYIMAGRRSRSERTANCSWSSPAVAKPTCVRLVVSS